MSACADGGHDIAPRTIAAIDVGGRCVRSTECDDGLFCNGAERCDAGRCVAGTAPHCDDGDPCTSDGCTEGRGCAHIRSDVLACLPSNSEGDAGAEDVGTDARVDEIQTVTTKPPSDGARPPEVTCPSSVRVLDASTQEKLELYRGVTCVEGTVVLTANLSDLSPLASLRRVGGLKLSGPSANLSTLRSLVRVDGDLTIEVTYDSAEDVGADLHLLRWVGGDLRVYRPLAREDAFANLHYVGGNLTLFKASGEKGEPTRSFEALYMVAGDVSVESLATDGLPALVSVGRNLSLAGATQEQIDSLAQLREVGGTLSLVGTTASAAAFPALERVSGLLQVLGNARLTELLLPRIERVGRLDVRLNPRLSRCYADALHTRVAEGLDAEPALCCNKGCIRCGGETCEAAGDLTSGQSTKLLGEIVVGPMVSPECLASVERAETLTFDPKGPSAMLSTLPLLPLREVGALVIRATALSDLSGLSQLRQAGSLLVQSNSELRSLHGLENLESVAGTLRVISNTVLSDVSALDPKRTGSLRELKGTASIASNPQLSQCEATALASSLDAITDSNVTATRNLGCMGSCAGPLCVERP